MANGAIASAGTKDKRVDRIEEGLGGIQSTVDALTKATLAKVFTGNDNNLTFTAAQDGLGGNDVTVAFVQEAGTTHSLAVVVAGNAVTVNLKVTASSIASTAAEVIAALKASAPASRLLTARLTGSDAGAGTGAGLVEAFVAAALTGGTAVTRSTFDAGIASGGKRPTPSAQVYTDEGQGSKTPTDSVKWSQPSAW